MSGPHPEAGMELDEYAKMAELDDSMWWYRALHRHVLFLLRRFGPAAPADVLDAGCGTGGLLRTLAREVPGHRYRGLEIHPPACAVAERRTGLAITCGSVNQLPFADESLDVVVHTDILSQGGVVPAEALAETFRVLRPGGRYLMHDTAYQWLLSKHDEHVDVVRRFTRPQLRGMFAEAGFTHVYDSHWNTLLFPVVVLRRKVFTFEDSASDVRQYSPVAEAIFGALMATERAALGAGLRLPFGVSILAVGEKPQERAG